MATPSSSSRVKRGSVALDRLLQAAAAITVAVSLLTVIDTGQHFIELLSHFRPQYLVVSLLLLILFALRRQMRFGVLVALAVTLNAGYVLPWYAGSAVAAAATANPAELKILSANVFSGNREHGRLLALIESEQPDVIALQEISAQWLTALQGLAVDYPHYYGVPRDDNYGIAIWSRLPLSAATHVDSPPLGYPSILTSIDIGGVAVTLITAHPMIPVGADNFTARNQQLRSIEAIVAATTDPVILIGDLNASIWDRHYRHFEDATGLRNARRGHGVLPTWPTFMPPAMIPIDHVLVSGQIGVTDIRTGPRIGSDHLPLVVTVSL